MGNSPLLFDLIISRLTSLKICFFYPIEFRIFYQIFLSFSVGLFSLDSLHSKEIDRFHSKGIDRLWLFELKLKEDKE